MTPGMLTRMTRLATWRKRKATNVRIWKEKELMKDFCINRQVTIFAKDKISENVVKFW